MLPFPQQPATWLPGWALFGRRIPWKPHRRGGGKEGPGRLPASCRPFFSTSPPALAVFFPLLLPKHPPLCCCSRSLDPLHHRSQSSLSFPFSCHDNPKVRCRCTALPFTPPFGPASPNPPASALGMDCRRFNNEPSLTMASSESSYQLDSPIFHTKFPRAASRGCGWASFISSNRFFTPP